MLCENQQILSQSNKSTYLKISIDISIVDHRQIKAWNIELHFKWQSYSKSTNDCIRTYHDVITLHNVLLG